MNEKLWFCILIQISLKFVTKGSIDNKSVLVQVMAWRRKGDKSLPEPMLAQIADAYMRHCGRFIVVWWHQTATDNLVIFGSGNCFGAYMFSAKLIPDTILSYSKLHPWDKCVENGDFAQVSVGELTKLDSWYSEIKQLTIRQTIYWVLPFSYLLNDVV